MARQKKPADAVQFTRESAERIAGVVRQAELTPAAASPLTFDRRLPDRIPKQVRAATFSGRWTAGSTKTVTFSNTPTAQVAAINLLWPLESTSYSNTNCLVGKDGTSWYLVAPELDRSSAVFVTETTSCILVTEMEVKRCVADITIDATFNSEDCSVSVDVTKKNTDFFAPKHYLLGGIGITKTATLDFLTVRRP